MNVDEKVLKYEKNIGLYTVVPQREKDRERDVDGQMAPTLLFPEIHKYLLMDLILYTCREKQYLL